MYARRHDDRTIDAITSMVLAMQDQESVALPMYEQQLQEANTGINNLLNAIQQGILTKSTKSRLEELEAARDDLENKIALEKLAKPRISEEFVRFFLERFRNLDLSKLEHQKMLIEVFLNAVYVFNDKIVISCNYKDGTKTVNFSEMESALTLRASASGSDLDCPGAPKPSKTLSFRGFSLSCDEKSDTLQLDLGFKCNRPLTRYLRAAFLDMERQGIAPISRREHFLSEESALGTFHYCVLRRRASGAEAFTMTELWALRTRDFLQGAAGIREEWYTDEDTDVEVEWIPLSLKEDMPNERIVRQPADLESTASLSR